MSGAMENRAAVFTSSSQDVEIFRAGAWWCGSLLGWRHEPDGSCQVWVRAVVAGVERSEWTGLDDVRLPERPMVHAVPVAVGLDALGARTVGLVAVRDPGRGVADERAGDTRRAGGRRRAPEGPETAEVPAWGAAARASAGSGRHRAPAPADPAAGRHRAADTGAFPPVGADGQPAGPGRTAPPLRTRRPDGGRAGGSGAAGLGTTGRALPVVPEQAGAGDDGEFHTRPLRLASSVPHPRTPRRVD